MSIFALLWHINPSCAEPVLMITPGTLYIVATPIGNLDDISGRAIEVLRQVDCIYAEDTRHSARLLQHVGVTTRTISVHEHNEQERVSGIVRALTDGESAALISDAGTPLISDPGYRLVSACHEHGIPVSPVPGPCALVAALSVSGLPTDRFLYLGFLPAKTAARQQAMQALVQESCTLVFYESRHRITAWIKSATAVFGEDRLVTVARELTKTYETLKHGSLAVVSEWLQEDAQQQKGEFVIMLAGASPKAAADDEQLVRVLTLLLPEVGVKKAAALASSITGAGRNRAYDLALSLKPEN